MEKLFDIQRDYMYLLSKSIELLAQDGSIFFSTNSRTFRFQDHLEATSMIEITHKTIPCDFHNQKIHRCWHIKRT